MMSKSAMIHSLFLSGVLVPFGATAHADNINTSGVSCHSFHAADALDISYLTNGVYNNNAASRDVICPVPRSPLASTPFTSFYVDGINAHNTSTSCTVYSFDYDGTFLGSQSFTQTASATAASNWDQPVTFPIEQLPTYAYVSVVCTLPGNLGGVIRGVTAVQP